MSPHRGGEGGFRWGCEGGVSLTQDLPGEQGGAESQPRALHQDDHEAAEEPQQCPVCKDPALTSYCSASHLFKEHFPSMALDQVALSRKVGLVGPALR